MLYYRNRNRNGCHCNDLQVHLHRQSARRKRRSNSDLGFDSSDYSNHVEWRSPPRSRHNNMDDWTTSVDVARGRAWWGNYDHRNDSMPSCRPHDRNQENSLAMSLGCRSEGDGVRSSKIRRHDTSPLALLVVETLGQFVTRNSLSRRLIRFY